MTSNFKLQALANDCQASSLEPVDEKTAEPLVDAVCVSNNALRMGEGYRIWYR